MIETRPATVQDAALIADQRRRMFVDSGQTSDQQMQPVIASFIPWVTPKLADGSYAGWLMEDSGRVVAGAGLWVMEFPPHFLDPEPRRAYLLNFYVAPEMRSKGLARELLALAVAEAGLRGIKVISLHASKLGRPLYEQSGFVPSNEMLLSASNDPK